MRMGRGAGLLLTATLLAGALSGCKGFWDAPNSSSFTLSSSPSTMSVAPGASGTSTITVTPGSSFTGTVSLACSVTSTPTSAPNPATCSLSSSSLTFSSSTAQTSTLTANTSSTTTTGSYGLKVTGTSGSASASTTLCAQVTTGTDTCTVTSGNSGVFYVLNQGTKQIAAYSIVSGNLTQIGSPQTLSAAPYSIAIAPNGNFLYVGTASGIFLFNIASGGSITLGNSSNAISQDFATTMQVDSTNSWLVEAGPNLAELLAIHINSSTGVELSSGEQNTVLPAATVNQLTISPDNAHVFVALGGAGTEDVTFAAGNATPFGTVSNLKVVNSGGAALSVAVDPQSRLLYVGEVAAVSGSNTGGIRVINYNTLQDVSGSPIASGGLAPWAIEPAQVGANKGNYVYVVNRTVSGSSAGNVVAFSVTTSGGVSTLTSVGSAVSAGVTPQSLVQDSTGNYLLVVDSGGSPDLEAYTFTSGVPTSPLPFATGTGSVQAWAIAAAP